MAVFSDSLYTFLFSNHHHPFSDSFYTLFLIDFVLKLIQSNGLQPFYSSVHAEFRLSLLQKRRKILFDPLVPAFLVRLRC